MPLPSLGRWGFVFVLHPRQFPTWCFGSLFPALYSGLAAQTGPFAGGVIVALGGPGASLHLPAIGPRVFSYLPDARPAPSLSLALAILPLGLDLLLISQEIGFQNPHQFQTDLRGGGMLGPLCLLYFVDRHPRLLRSVWIRAKDDPATFPLAAIGIGATVRSLRAMDEKALHKLALAGGSMTDAFFGVRLAAEAARRPPDGLAGLRLR